MDNLNIAPFYVGQKVLGSDRVPALSKVKKGHPYVISHCEYKMNRVNGLWFWYVGIPGHHDWLAPYLFVPVEEKFEPITLEKILEEETKLINAN